MRILFFADEIKMLTDNNIWEYVVIPFVVAVLISFFIGLERQNIGKSAGVSPHVLIAASACVIAIIQRFLYFDQGGTANADNQRLIAQVLPGVGFIGAGVIMKGERTIVGLTTAATVWTVAIIGLMIGSGYVLIGGGFGLSVLAFVYIRDFKRGINPFKAHTHYDFGEVGVEDELKRHT